MQLLARVWILSYRLVQCTHDFVRAKVHDFDLVRNVLYWVAEPRRNNAGKIVALSRIVSRWKLLKQHAGKEESDAQLSEFVRRYSGHLKPVRRVCAC